MRKTNKLHFYSGDCSDPQVQKQIKEQFIQLLNASLFNEVCQADTLRDRCTADNVKVTCYVATRRRRSLAGEFKGIFLHYSIMEGPKPMWPDNHYQFYGLRNFKQSWTSISRFPSMKMFLLGHQDSASYIFFSYLRAIEPDLIKARGYLTLWRQIFSLSHGCYIFELTHQMTSPKLRNLILPSLAVFKTGVEPSFCSFFPN